MLHVTKLKIFLRFCPLWVLRYFQSVLFGLFTIEFTSRDLFPPIKGICLSTFSSLRLSHFELCQIQVLDQWEGLELPSLPVCPSLFVSLYSDQCDILIGIPYWAINHFLRLYKKKNSTNWKSLFCPYLKCFYQRDRN